MSDSDHMNLAIELAKKGRGYTSPNPMVGAVVVRDNKIVGRGWHRRAGLAHAEVEAIDDAGKKSFGSTIYVTLEPCNHTGRTPPCTEKIIRAGIKRVVVGALDPNPFVSGGGVARLKESGITVKTGLLKSEAETLIEDFIWYVRNKKRPFVILKCAATLDGRLATRTGDSKWITNEMSRAKVHRLRHAVDGILVGAGTVRADNPSLTARINGFRTKDPRRIILDAGLTIDETSTVLTQASDADTIVVAGEGAPTDKRERLESQGVRIISVPDKKGMIDLVLLMEKLGSMGIMSLLIEGGGGVIGSALRAGIVNKALFFLAPKILGGDDGVPVCRGTGPEFMKNAAAMTRVKTRHFGDDLLIEGYLK